MRDFSADLDRIIERDRRTFRNYLAMGAAVVLAGLAVLVAGFVIPFEQGGEETQIQALLVKLGGALIGTFSTIPLKQCFDRRERLAAVEMIREKWRELMGAPSPPESEVNRIENIVWKLYERRVLG